MKRLWNLAQLRGISVNYFLHSHVSNAFEDTQKYSKYLFQCLANCLHLFAAKPNKSENIWLVAVA